MTLGTSMNITAQHGSRPAISIVSTMYNSGRFLDEFLQGCLDALAEVRCMDFAVAFLHRSLTR